MDQDWSQISGGIRLEIKCTTNVMLLNLPETSPPTPSPWKICLPRNRLLAPKRLRTTALGHLRAQFTDETLKAEK